MGGLLMTIRRRADRHSRKLLRYVMVAAFTALFGIPVPGEHAIAAPVTVPVDLAPGQQYRLAFITCGTRDGDPYETDDAFAHSKKNDLIRDHVNSQPALAALGSFWEVIASFSTSLYARDLTDTDPTVDGAGVPIYLLDGTTRIADDYADLWDGALAAPIHIREDGTPLGDGVHHIFTGTDSFGNVTPDTEVGSMGFITAGRIIVGNPSWPFSANNVTWIRATTIDASDSHHYYGLSGLLTVPQAVAIPAPGAGFLIALGVAGCVLARRRRVARTRA